MDLIQALVKESSPTNSLTKFSQASLEIVDVGLREQANAVSNDDRVSAGTEDFCIQPAMSEEQLLKAVLVGVEVVNRIHQEGGDLFVSGAVSRGNKTSALAMISVLSGKPAEDLMLMGRSRLLPSEKNELALIEQALEVHRDKLNSPLRILQHLGGL